MSPVIVAGKDRLDNDADEEVLGSRTADAGETVDGPSAAKRPEEFAGAPLPAKEPRMGPGLLLTGSVLVFAAVLTMILVRHSRGDAKRSVSSVFAGATAGVRPSATVRERYLQGVYFYEKRTPVDLQKAQNAFEDCIRDEPHYAAAHAGLANTFLLLREYATMPDAEAYRRAQEAAERAVALDPKLAEAHAALGFIDFFYQWKPDDAEREFKTAVRLEPNSALAHHWYGSMLMHEARFREALEQLNEAQRLQPTSAAILGLKVYALGLSGHRHEATETLEALGAQTGDTSSLHRTMASLSLMEPRDIPRYLDERRRFAEIRQDGEELGRLRLAAAAYRRAGEQTMWRALLTQERASHGSSAQPTFEMARLESVLGENERAVRDLLTLVDTREPMMVGAEVDTMLEPLRRTEAYERVRAAMHLPHSARGGVIEEVDAFVSPAP